MPTPPGIKLSTNARLWWDAAESEARARGHVKISTEHLLWALCSEEAASTFAKRLRDWFGGTGSSTWRAADDAASPLDAIREYMTPAAGEDSAMGWFGESQYAPAGVEFGPSDSVLHALRFAHHIRGGNTEEFAAVAEVDTESLFAGLLHEGTGVAARVIDDIGWRRGLHLKAMLSAMGVAELAATYVDPDADADADASGGGAGGAGGTAAAPSAPAADDTPWEVLHAVGGSAAAALVPGRVEGRELPDVADVEAYVARAAIASTDGTPERFCWLVPGCVLMGPSPGASMVPAILAHGVTTFVCLQHENRGRYLRDVRREIRNGSCRHLVELLWFPIEDFYVKPARDVRLLVEEMARRVKAGETIYLHCAGGHGRTGTIAIVFLKVLYGLSIRDASRLAKRMHNARWGCGDRCNFPEEATHERQLYALSALPKAAGK